jgi:hypothetical protein
LFKSLQIKADLQNFDAENPRTADRVSGSFVSGEGDEKIGTPFVEHPLVPLETGHFVVGFSVRADVHNGIRRFEVFPLGFERQPLVLVSTRPLFRDFVGAACASLNHADRFRSGDFMQRFVDESILGKRFAEVLSAADCNPHHWPTPRSI